MISTILLSGGIGSRSGKNLPKQYCELNGKIIIKYCLDEIVNGGFTQELVVVYGHGFLPLLESILYEYQDSFGVIKYVLGGKTRQESVYNGVKACSFDSILLHEAARPLITSIDLKTVVDHHLENVTMGIEIPFTVLKQKDGKISSVLSRDELFNVQLPQKFNRIKLIKAHEKAINDEMQFTDDSSLLFHYNNEVAVIKGSTENIKITTPEDFSIAKQIIIERSNKR